MGGPPQGLSYGHSMIRNPGEGADLDLHMKVNVFSYITNTCMRYECYYSLTCHGGLSNHLSYNIENAGYQYDYTNRSFTRTSHNHPA